MTKTDIELLVDKLLLRASGLFTHKNVPGEVIRKLNKEDRDNLKYLKPKDFYRRIK